VTSTISTWIAAVALVLSFGAVQGCSDDEEPEPAPSSSPSTGSPFSATFEGPDVAAAGDRVTATLTNTGRLPDRYRFVANPEGGATMTPPELSLGPQESAEVTIEVVTSPVIIRVESLGAGGSGVALAELSIGVQQ
jgi:hypothetical protein